MLVPVLTALFHAQVSPMASDPGKAHEKLTKALDTASERAERMIGWKKRMPTQRGFFKRYGAARAQSARIADVESTDG